MQISPVRNNFISQRINKPKQQNERLVDSDINNKECKQYSNTNYNHFNYISFNGASLNPASLENPLYDYDFRDFVAKEGKVTLAEYQEIKQKQPKLLKLAETFISLERKKIGMFQTPEDTAELVQAMQDWFDEEFDNNYIIVSIGTSPAFVTECMSALGKDVIFVPVSGVCIAPAEEEFEEYLEEYPRAKVVADYLKEELSKQGVENKSVILLDYKAHGTTLELFDKIARQHCGKSPLFVYKCDIGQLINELFGLETFSDYSKKYRDDVIDSTVEHIANVPHYYINYSAETLDQWKGGFDIEDEKSQYRELQNNSTPLGRAYQLLVLDELDKMKAF